MAIERTLQVKEHSTKERRFVLAGYSELPAGRNDWLIQQQTVRIDLPDPPEVRSRSTFLAGPAANFR